MAAIRGIYSTNPNTQEMGIWVNPSWLDEGDVIGFTQDQIDSINATATPDNPYPLQGELQTVLDNSAPYPGIATVRIPLDGDNQGGIIIT